MNYDLKNCRLCPRRCGADRTKSAGVCGVSDKIKLAKVSLHEWEEPPISFKNGAGTIFFSGCNLKCCFCQNYKISHECFGKEISIARLADIFLEQQDKGAENIELVSAVQFVPHIIDALDIVKHRLNIPVIYNSGGFELEETLHMLNGYIDIYMPDIKYFSPELSKKYSGAKDYFLYTKKAVYEMHRQQPKLIYDNNGKLLKGLIVRHLVLPHCRKDSIRIIDELNSILPSGSYLISLMSQYTPFYKAHEHKEIDRPITTFEYKTVMQRAEKYGMEGFFQSKSSSSEKYIPEFDLSGI